MLKGGRPLRRAADKLKSILGSLLLGLAVVASSGACSAGGQAGGTAPAGADAFRFLHGDADAAVAEDVRKTLVAHCPRVRGDLQFRDPTAYTVEIFEDQQSYDLRLSDRGVAGSPACSESGSIFLVSARSPIRVPGINYEQRLMMAVHEYTHLLINEINADAPMWLQEGIASYEGAEGEYVEKGDARLKLLPPIAFSEVEADYYRVQAADVYSFLAVKYIIGRYGYERLNRLLRDPDGFEDILSVSEEEFNSQWNEFVASYQEK